MKLVVCEGADDVSVLKALCRNLEVEGITIESCQGRNNLERYLAELLIRPEFTRGEVESVAVIIDAEESADNAWRKLRNAVALAFKLELIEPSEFVGITPRVLGFIVASGDGRGMIEDLCLASVSNRAGYPCLQEYFRCLSEATGQAAYHSKAKFRAWMASQSEFEYHVGKAAEHDLLDWTHEVFAPICKILRHL